MRLPSVTMHLAVGAQVDRRHRSGWAGRNRSRPGRPARPSRRTRRSAAAAITCAPGGKMPPISDVASRIDVRRSQAGRALPPGCRPAASASRWCMATLPTTVTRSTRCVMRSDSLSESTAWLIEASARRCSRSAFSRAVQRGRQARDDIRAKDGLLVQPRAPGAHLAVVQHGQEGRHGGRAQVDRQPQRHLGCACSDCWRGRFLLE